MGSSNDIVDLDNLLAANLLEVIPDACFIFDKNFYIVKMNCKAENIFLFPKDYMMSKPFWDIAPQYVKSEMYNFMFKMQKEKGEGYLEIKGSITGRWFAINARALGNYTITFFKDITANKHAQLELLRSEERFTAAFNKSPAIMSILSFDDGEYLSVNNSFLEHTGLSRNEIRGKRKEDIFRFQNSENTEEQREFFSNNPVQGVYITYNANNQDTRTVLISSEKININGKECLLEVGIDITERTKYQNEIIKLERLNLLGQMSASIAHEIRNPLQTVRGFLQVVESKKEMVPYLKFFDLMIKELDRANRIITEFLSLSRTKPTNLRLCNINEIVNKVLPLIKIQAIKEAKSVDSELNNVPDVWLDEDEIKQVLLNLIKNSLEAIKTYESVKISTIQDGDTVLLTVEDKGHGIPKEHQNKVGVPFFTTKSNGTGLGLTMSYNIMERHNASIEFQSDSKGTTFYLRFPKSEGNINSVL